jgi:hypothetical protein
MNNNSDFLIDEFRGVYKDEGLNTIKIRLFPFGKVFKGDDEISITPETASRFRLPHFKPPLKLGSHKEETPSGGSFVDLEVGDDGLYGLVELTDEGALAFSKKSYRYHSPEIIRAGRGLQDPISGETIEGPLLVGAALLHNPHLGEGAALYSVEPKLIDRGADKMEMTQVPTSWFERVMDAFKGQTPEREPERQPEQQPVTDEFAVQLQEKDTEIEAYRAKIKEMQDAQARQERVEHFASELPGEKEEVHVLLAGLDEEAAEALVVRFRALQAEVDLQPGETAGARGADEEPMAPMDRLNKVVEEYASEKGINFIDAFEAVRAEQPELFRASGG